MSEVNNRLFALGLTYVLTGGTPPSSFFVLVERTEDPEIFLEDLFEAAEALEDLGEEAVQDFLTAYALGLSSGEPLVTVEYDPEEGEASITYTSFTAH